MKPIKNLKKVEAIYVDSNPLNRSEIICTTIEIHFETKEDAVAFYESELKELPNRCYRLIHPSWHWLEAIKLHIPFGGTRADTIIAYLATYFELPPVLSVSYLDPKKIDKVDLDEVEDFCYTSIPTADSRLLTLPLSEFLLQQQSVESVIGRAFLPLTANLHKQDEVTAILSLIQQDKRRLLSFITNATQKMLETNAKVSTSTLARAATALEAIEKKEIILQRASNFQCALPSDIELQQRRQQYAYNTFFAANADTSDRRENKRLRSKSFNAFTR